VEEEAGRGDQDASTSRLTAIEGIAIQALSDDAVSVAERLIGRGRFRERPSRMLFTSPSPPSTASTTC